MSYYWTLCNLLRVISSPFQGPVLRHKCQRKHFCSVRRLSEPLDMSFKEASGRSYFLLFVHMFLGFLIKWYYWRHNTFSLRCLWKVWLYISGWKGCLFHLTVVLPLPASFPGDPLSKHFTVERVDCSGCQHRPDFCQLIRFRTLANFLLVLNSKTGILSVRALKGNDEGRCLKIWQMWIFL